MFISVVYLAVLISLCGVSLLCSAVAMNMYHKDASQPLPQILKLIMLGWLAKCLCYPTGNKMKKYCHKTSTVTIIDKDMPDHGVDTDHRQRLTNQSSTDPELMAIITKIQSDVSKLRSKLDQDIQDDNIKEEWKMAANIMDRLLTVTFFIINLVVVSALFMP